MDIDFLTRRQAVTEWRDHHVFAAVSAINRAAVAARAAFADQLPEAALVQSVWDPAGFVHGRIDALMREHAQGLAQKVLGDAAAELRRLDERLGPLASALAGSAPDVELPHAPDPLEDSDLDEESVQPAAKPVGTPAGVAGRIGDFVGELQLTRTAWEWGTWAADGIAGAAGRVSRSLQAGAGLDSRLQRVAEQRIATAWMGMAGDPRPLRSQLVSLIDEVCNEARSLNL